MVTLSVMTTPKCSGSMPAFAASGANTGVSSVSTEISSMNMPMTKMIRLSTTISSHGCASSPAPMMRLPKAWVTRSYLRYHPTTDAAPMIRKIALEVRTVSATARAKPRSVS